jgi:hypothetical protein
VLRWLFRARIPGIWEIVPKIEEAGYCIMLVGIIRRRVRRGRRMIFRFVEGICVRRYILVYFHSLVEMGMPGANE